MTQQWNSEELSELIQEKYQSGKTLTEVKEQLLSHGFALADVDPVIQTIRSTENARKMKIGMPLILFGAMLCLSGFLIACLSTEHNTLFHVGLYGLTGVGSLLILVGLMLILG